MSAASQNDLEPRASAIRSVAGADASVVAFRDPSSDGQAEARATRRCVGRPPEAVEEVRQILGANARAIVLDADRRMRSGPDHDPDSATPRRVAQGIVDEDRDELAQPLRVPHYGGRCRVEPNLDPARIRRRAHRGDGFPGDLGEVDR